MKKFNLVVFALTFLSVQSFAAGRPVWTCGDDTNIEGAGVSEFNGVLTGSVSWDCFPGGGICNAEAAVIPSRDGSGDVVYRGRYFSLTIHTSAEPENGVYRAHLIAKDMVDASDQGRGLVFNQFITCKEGQ